VRFSYEKDDLQYLIPASADPAPDRFDERSAVDGPVDAEGHIFIDYNPGRYYGVIVLRPTEEGFASFGSLPPPDDSLGERWRFYSSRAVDVDGDGTYEIEENVNTCDPSCAAASYVTTLYRWTGTDYVP
jgi:hypothetical protein